MKDKEKRIPQCWKHGSISCVLLFWKINFLAPRLMFLLSQVCYQYSAWKVKHLKWIKITCQCFPCESDWKCKLWQEAETLILFSREWGEEIAGFVAAAPGAGRSSRLLRSLPLTPSWLLSSPSSHFFLSSFFLLPISKLPQPPLSPLAALLFFFLNF